MFPPLRVLTADQFAELPADVHDAVVAWIVAIGHDPEMVTRVAWSARTGMGWLRFTPFREVVLRNVPTPPEWGP
jgi:hypothetical protein